MIGFAFAIALLGQDMTQAEMIAEGAQIGRAAAAIGVCGELGYTVYQDTGRRWADDFEERGVMSGWSIGVLSSAIEAGTADEVAEMDLTMPTHSGDDDAFIAAATAVYDRLKARCRRLGVERAGLISGLDAGDRNADAKLAIMLAPLRQ
jgi:hypothetical protein